MCKVHWDFPPFFEDFKTLYKQHLAIRYGLCKVFGKLNSKFAPVGFGYGGHVSTYINASSESEFESSLDNFIATMKDDEPHQIRLSHEDIPVSLCTIIRGNANYVTVDAFTFTSNRGKWVKQKINGVWQPHEWITPLMQLGVEYRTTERWNGYTVYTKLIEIGTLPNNSSKYVYDVIPIGAYVTSFDGTGRHTDGTIMPICTLVHEVFATRDYGYVGVNTVSDLSSYAAYITVKYIKP